MDISRYDFTEDEILGLEMTSGAMVNEVTILFAYDYSAGNFTAALTKRNPASQLIYGVFADTVECRMIQPTRQAETIADAILKTSSQPPVTAVFIHANLRSLLLEVGDAVTLTHRAGIGSSGYQAAPGTVSKKVIGKQLSYEVAMSPAAGLYASELVTLSRAGTVGNEGVTVSYANGVATLTIYASVDGSPPIEGAEVTINAVKQITDKKGQVRFNLQPGRYTAQISASGYEDAQITFNV
jgi:hypothetical protein